jgi:hypothetical protein
MQWTVAQNPKGSLVISSGTTKVGKGPAPNDEAANWAASCLGQANLAMAPLRNIALRFQTAGRNQGGQPIAGRLVSDGILEGVDGGCQDLGDLLPLRSALRQDRLIDVVWGHDGGRLHQEGPLPIPRGTNLYRKGTSTGTTHLLRFPDDDHDFMK